MLKMEVAQKRLKQFRIKDWNKSRLASMGELPTTLRTVGRYLLDRDAEGKPFKNWEKRITAGEEARDVLARASARDRQRLFSILFPKLAGHLEAAWQLCRKLPYEVDYERKGFRAPNDALICKEAQMSMLCDFINELSGYDPDIAWVAAWAPHLSGGYSEGQLGLLLGAAIDAGGPEGEQVFEILRESATNEHEIGGMGRHITRALLVASRPEGWEFVEKLLLAAQRQEGLRQVILESIDEAHPEAFRRMLRLILEHNLLRFSATVRAIDVWFGLRWDALTPAVLKKTVELTLRFLEDRQAREQALEKETGDPLYLALWATAFEDAETAIEPARRLLKDKSVERRYVAVHFLAQLGLAAGKAVLVDALDDEDLRIAVTALENGPEGEGAPDLWDRIVALLNRMPAKKQEGEALVWPWATVRLDRKEVAGKLDDYRGKRPATALLPFINDLESWDRGHLVESLARLKKWDAPIRDTLFALVGDRDSWVRDKALHALKKCAVTEADAQRVEALLVRKGTEMRQGILTLLRKQPISQVLVSADRLLVSKKAPQRQAGLELLRVLVEKKKAVAECRQRAEAYRAAHPSPGEEEELHLEAILDIHRERPSLKNALGLMDPTALSKPIEPVPRKVILNSAAAMACLQALDQLVHKHRETPIKLAGWRGDEEEILGNVTWGFPDPDPTCPIDEDIQKRLPLFEIWKEWYENRPKKLKDADGLEMLRASVWWVVDPAERKREVKRFGKHWSAWLDLESNGQATVKLKHPQIVASLVQWFLRMDPPAGVVDFLLDALETAFAHVPAELRSRVVDIEDWMKRDRDWRCNSPVMRWFIEIENYRELVPDAWTDKQRLRLWQLFHWRDQPAPGVARMRPEMEHLIAGFKGGQANEADLVDHLLGPGQDDFEGLRELTRLTSHSLKDCPALVPIVERIRERILEIELKRGELPTAATAPAKAICSLTGIPTLLRLLAALGKKSFARSTWGEGRVETLTQLIEFTFPGNDETPEAFASAVKQARIPNDRLLQLAFLAPSWLEYIEQAIGWPGLKEGVWWFLAHIPGGNPGVHLQGEEEEDFADFDDEDFDDEDEVREKQVRPLNPWEKIIRERTPLTEEQRQAGAVDPSWFHRVYAPLGKKRWEELAEAAKYGCSGAGHKKAIRLSDVLLGRVKKSELVSEIRDRNLKESVRLLGLLPLPEGDKREHELLSRYKVLIEYRRYARSLGPLSREEAVRTATIGMENLALTAGYADPIRLEWAMEAKQIADLAEGPISVTAEGVTVTLSISTDAQPELTVQRGEKPLKSIPSAVRKNPKVATLVERRTDLKRQASRVKQSLEAMMICGDHFSGHELRQLFEHPLLRPLLERLVILGEGIRGYPIAGGQALEDCQGKREPVKRDERLRLAHPHDLFSSGDWDRWQHQCFTSEKVQPFKQVFRELYVLTQQEKTDGTVSHRYAGQQVQPRQAMALWGSRGWSVSDEVMKTFHDEGLIAEVTFRHHGWTPAQVEGLTIEDISFRKVGEYQPIRLDKVPPRLFSEVMRDGDLVVSVAHVGGVDPEASASTVQLREALLRETCALLNINNYKVQKSHVLITGKLGKYSIHLGSGVVHRMPGGHVCVVPVHAQHRGRLFLPFADDDPRTAEILSKVLLFARDNEIQDPTILEQIR
jgi:hypothetical protein